MGRMKMQVLKNQVPGGGIIKYGKTKYEWQGWKMQVRKKQVLYKCVEAESASTEK